MECDTHIYIFFLLVGIFSVCFYLKLCLFNT
nr:MAG TPA: hypothetical protein [Caudoviricetes sp.]